MAIQNRQNHNRKISIYEVCRDYESWSTDQLAQDYKFVAINNVNQQELSFEDFYEPVDEESETLEEMQREETKDERWN